MDSEFDRRLRGFIEYTRRLTEESKQVAKESRQQAEKAVKELQANWDQPTDGQAPPATQF